MRFLRRSLVGVFLLAMTVALVGAAGRTVWGALQEAWADGPPPRQQQERVFAANVLPYEPAAISPVITTYGEIQSRRSLELRARTGGTVIELVDGFEEGGAVEAGAVIARIDPADAEAVRASARADLADAAAELREAERGVGLARDDLASAEAQAELRARALDRQRDLDTRGVGTAAAVETAELAASSAAQAVVSRRQALSQAEARLDRARTGLDRRQIELDEAERRLKETRFVAAFDGVLAEVAAVEGGLVTAGERLAVLIDPSALEVAFRLSTAQFDRLLDVDGRVQAAEVTVALDVLGVDLTAAGRISRVAAVVGEGQTGRLVYARLGPAPGFRPGDFVTVAIEEPPLEGVALLPASALGGEGTVLVLDAEDRLEEVPVELLRRQGDDVVVRSAALVGREVVAERSPLLGAGIKVRPIRRGEAGSVPEPEMVELSEERRAALVAFVEGSERMPSAAKERVLAQLRAPQVPVQVVERIEQRMGG